MDIEVSKGGPDPGFNDQAVIHVEVGANPGSGGSIQALLGPRLPAHHPRSAFWPKIGKAVPAR